MAAIMSVEFEFGDWIDETATIKTNMFCLKLNRLDYREFFHASNACINNTDWIGKTVYVKNGTVSIHVRTEDENVGYIELPAHMCGEVFRKAYDDVSARHQSDIEIAIR